MRFTLTNTGPRDGDEVAQAYLRERKPGSRWQLAGFQRIFLKAGEHKELNFILPINPAGLEIAVSGRLPDGKPPFSSTSSPEK